MSGDIDRKLLLHLTISACENEVEQQ